MSGVIALMASHENARLRSRLFILLALASLAFVFATLLSVLILPFMGSIVQLNERATRGLLFLYAVVVSAIIVGTILLAGGIAGVGFMVSRRVGQCTLWCTITASVAFFLCVFFLANILR